MCKEYSEKTVHSQAFYCLPSSIIFRRFWVQISAWRCDCAFLWIFSFFLVP